jgi:hypothetical protein
MQRLCRVTVEAARAPGCAGAERQERHIRSAHHSLRRAGHTRSASNLLCLPACLSVFLSVFLSIFLSICLSVCRSFCLSVWPVSPVMSPPSTDEARQGRLRAYSLTSLVPCFYSIFYVSKNELDGGLHSRNESNGRMQSRNGLNGRIHLQPTGLVLEESQCSSCFISSQTRMAASPRPSTP